MRKVFLSSTARDLGPFRQAVYDALESLDGYHCVRMENFGARDSGAAMFDRTRIEECDLFIGIVGACYGNTPPGQATSFTELEFEAAVALAKPRLMFLSHDFTPDRDDLDQSREDRARLKAFRRRVSDERIVDFFSSSVDLSLRVVRSIFNWERTQWKHLTPRPPAHPRWATIPHLPRAHIAHPYPLQDHFTGRFRERQMLTEWYAEGRHSLMFLIGIGGLGKSALTWVWSNWDLLDRALPGLDPADAKAGDATVLPESRRPEGFLWWSFYEAESSFPAFLDEALIYASSGEIAPERISSHYDKARMLLALLQQKSLLLVWDGFERLQRAYSGLDAVYREEGGRIGDPRSCTEPLVAKFMQWLASTPLTSRLLVTSRLYPKDLEDAGGLPLAACRREELTSLDPEDAVALFWSMGVQGTRLEIRLACAPYGYHALALRLLCGYIVNHPSRPCDVQVAPRYDASENLIPREHHVLELAYGALSPRHQGLLSRMAAFRSPVEIEAIVSLEVDGPGIEVEAAIRVLVSRGLVWLDRTRGRCDMHPVVRRYAYSRLSDKEDVHRHLRGYFSAIPEPEYEQVRSVEELAQVIELFHHTVRAGLPGEAFKLFQARLRPVLERLGAFYTEVELLQVFLHDDLDRIDDVLDENDDVLNLLNILSVNYGYIGQLRQALRFLEAIRRRHPTDSIHPQGTSHRAAYPWNTLGNMCYFQLRLGRLAEAEETQRHALGLIESDDRAPWERLSDMGYGRMRLGLIQAFESQSERAMEEFRTARSLFQRSDDRVGECHLWNYRVIRARIIGDPRLAIVCARHALSLAESAKEARLVTRSQSTLAGALIDAVLEGPTSRGHHLMEAERLLSEALSRCRRVDLIEMEPTILLNWARWHDLKGDRHQARQDAEEALALAQRCEFRLDQADIHMFRARLELKDGNLEASHIHAQAALQLAQCDGPPHCYRVVHEAASELLMEPRRGSMPSVDPPR